MTNRELQKLTDSQREAIIKYHASETLKLGELAKSLGVDGIKVSSMKVGVSGQIAREGDKYVIRVNRNESRERQRFTIAHELSHFLLHKSIIDFNPDGITDNVLYRSGAAEHIEYEANRLAAEILMPMEKLKRLLSADFHNIVTDATIESLAGRFQVSKSAMEIRLSNLV